MRLALVIATCGLLSACGPTAPTAPSGPPPLTCADFTPDNVAQFVGRDVEFHGAWLSHTVRANSLGEVSESNTFVCRGAPIDTQPFAVREPARKSSSAQSALASGMTSGFEYVVRGRIAAVENLEAVSTYGVAGDVLSPVLTDAQIDLSYEVTDTAVQAPPDAAAQPADPPAPPAPPDASPPT